MQILEATSRLRFVKIDKDNKSPLFFKVETTEQGNDVLCPYELQQYWRNTNDFGGEWKSIDVVEENKKEA